MAQDDFLTSLAGPALFLSLAANVVLGVKYRDHVDELAQKDTQIIALTTQVKDAQKTLASKEGEIDQKDGQIKEKEDTIKKKEQSINAVQGQLNDEKETSDALASISDYLGGKLDELDGIFNDYDSAASQTTTWLFNNCQEYSDIDQATEYYYYWQEQQQSIANRYWSMMDEINSIFQ